MPKISVIICSRNRAAQLIGCLRSISANEMMKVDGELILVDNGSSDRTNTIMLFFRKKAIFPVTVMREDKKGLSNARNAGLLNSKGEIVVFTDDDCYLPEGYLINVLTFFESSEFDYCGGQIWLCDSTDGRIGYKYFNETTIFKPCTLLDAGVIQGANMIFRRRVINKIGLFDTMLGAGTPFPCEDIDYVARCTWAGFTGANIPELIIYHHHGRKPGRDIEQIMRSYDYGRGAYYTKFILKGKLVYLKQWYRQYRKYKKAKLKSKFRNEILGGVKYLLARMKKYLNIYFFCSQLNFRH